MWYVRCFHAGILRKTQQQSLGSMLSVYGSCENPWSWLSQFPTPPQVYNNLIDTTITLQEFYQKYFSNFSVKQKVCEWPDINRMHSDTNRESHPISNLWFSTLGIKMHQEIKWKNVYAFPFQLTNHRQDETPVDVGKMDLCQWSVFPSKLYLTEPAKRILIKIVKDNVCKLWEKP